MCEINTNLTSTRPSQCNNRLLQSIVVLIITTCKLTVEKDKKKKKEKGKRKRNNWKLCWRMISFRAMVSCFPASDNLWQVFLFNLDDDELHSLPFVLFDYLISFFDIYIYIYIYIDQCYWNDDITPPTALQIHTFHSWLSSIHFSSHRHGC